MKKSLNFLLKIFFAVFFPEECLSCQKVGETICKNCLAKISQADKQRNFDLDWLETALDYQKPELKNIFYHLKYHHNKLVAKYLAKIVVERFLIFARQKTEFKNFLIVPIPISKKRRRERGYNQTEVLLEEILQEILEKERQDLRSNYKPDFLLRGKHTIKFSETQTKEERINLIKGAFNLNEKYSNSTEQKIILVDDITTSGATFYEARRVLLENGFKKENIFAFALAH